jgi:mono/diheme cytochrome c family protein
MRLHSVIFALWLSSLMGATRPCTVYGSVEVADARASYLRHCATCHGRDGKGDGPNARSVPVRIHSFTDCNWMSMTSDAVLFLIIKEGSSSAGFPAGMPPSQGILDDEQIAQLVGYVRKFCSTK